MRRAGWRGYRFGPLPADLDARLDQWLARGRVEDDEAVVIKPARVWRVGAFVVKITESKGRVRDRIRPSPALRAARFACRLPVATPRPLVALQTAGWGIGPRRGVLVTEYVRGVLLEDCWREDEYAMRCFTRFLATLYRSRTFHGDFHWRNQIWSAERDAWYLLDLEGLRHPLRRIFPGRLMVEQWARLSYCLRRGEDLRPHFDRFFEEAGLAGSRDDVWRRVRERAARIDQSPGSIWRAPGREAVASGLSGRSDSQRRPAE